MKGDFSRNSFDPNKHYRGVRMQQGRVQMDADWNEQIDITDHRDRLFTDDFLGEAVGPSNNAGFAIGVTTSNPQDLTIGLGRYYVDGLLVENSSSLYFTQQTDYPQASLPTQDGVYLAYLDVWQRSLSIADDPDMAESALGGADTATRLYTVAQVKLMPADSTDITSLAHNTLFNANAAIDSVAYNNAQKWNALTCHLPSQVNAIQLLPNVGTLKSSTDTTYHIQIHQGGNAAQATYKVSTDSPLIDINIGTINGNVITLPQVPNGQAPFAVEQWLELTIPLRDNANLPGYMAQVTGIQDDDTGLTLTLSGTIGNDITVPNGARARRWQQDVIKVTDHKKPPLETDLTINFLGNTFKSGSYWKISTDAANHTISWPTNNNGQFIALSPNSSTISQLTPSVVSPTLQNQLYRVEIHDAFATAILKSTTQLTLKSMAGLLSAVGHSSLMVGDLLQLTTDTRLAAGKAADTVTITGVSSDGNTITFTETLDKDMIVGDSVNIIAAKASAANNYSNTATFKWSRDNASVSSSISAISSNNITLTTLPQDGINSFSISQWLELTTPARELIGMPGDMVQITSVNSATLAVNGTIGTDISVANNAIARRWDMAVASSAKAVNDIVINTLLPLENGLSVKFTGNGFSMGDYWLIPARAALNSQGSHIDWPTDGVGNYLTQLPDGIQHSHAPLAIVQRSGGKWTFKSDARTIAIPLSELNIKVIGADPCAPANTIHVDCDGQVGISTDMPKAKLDIETSTGIVGQDAVHAIANSNGVAITAVTNDNKAAILQNNSTQPTLNINNNGTGNTAYLTNSNSTTHVTLYAESTNFTAAEFSNSNAHPTLGINNNGSGNGINASVGAGNAAYLTNNSTTHLTLYVENTGDQTAAEFVNKSAIHPTLSVTNNGSTCAASFTSYCDDPTLSTLNVTNTGGGDGIRIHANIGGAIAAWNESTTPTFYLHNTGSGTGISALAEEGYAGQFVNNGSGAAGEFLNTSLTSPTLYVQNYDSSGEALQAHGNASISGSLSIGDTNSGSFSVIPTPHKVPVADQYGHINAGWLPANYARAVFVDSSYQEISKNSKATKINFDGALGNGSLWWDSANSWFLPTIAGKYAVKAVVNSIPRTTNTGLQWLTLETDINKNAYTTLGTLQSPSTPMQLMIPGIVIQVNGVSNYIFLSWTNNGDVPTKLGYDGVSGLGADFTNYFEIVYLGT